MMSDDGTESRIVQCLEYGAVDYVIKPFNVAALRARVAAVLQQRAHGIVARRGRAPTSPALTHAADAATAAVGERPAAMIGQAAPAVSSALPSPAPGRAAASPRLTVTVPPPLGMLQLPPQGSPTASSSSQGAGPQAGGPPLLLDLTSSSCVSYSATEPELGRGMGMLGVGSLPGLPLATSLGRAADEGAVRKAGDAPATTGATALHAVAAGCDKSPRSLLHAVSVAPAAAVSPRRLKQQQQHQQALQPALVRVLAVDDSQSVILQIE
jgi:CheY-like chemotaxis protein